MHSEWDKNPNARPRLVVQSQFWDALSDNDSTAARPLWPSILTPEIQLRGDWYDLMMSVTEGDFDLVDDLFIALGHGRSPAGDHVFLAQLADAFRVRLYLSLNFDPLLETALWNEGHAPNVIEVAKDANLPSAEAVRDRLTVLKLHGGAYGVRIGERIQESVDQNTQSRALDLIPEDALLLVMGFSGYERRMTQILVGHCRRDTEQTGLLWMNFSQTRDKPLQKILRGFGVEKPNGPIVVRNYYGVSSLLQSVLVRARGAHPAGRQHYPALPTSPWAKSQKLEKEKPIVAFFRPTDWDENNPNPGHSDASVAMARFCADKAKTHHTICNTTPHATAIAASPNTPRITNRVRRACSDSRARPSRSGLPGGDKASRPTQPSLSGSSLRLVCQSSSVSAPSNDCFSTSAV